MAQALGLLLGPLACAGGDTVLYVPRGESASVLVVVIPEDGPGQVIGAEQSMPDAITVSDLGDARLFALYFDCGLEAMRLPESVGLISASRGGRPIPTPSRALSSQFLAGDQSEWIEEPTSLEALAPVHLDLPPLTRCVSFEPSSVVYRNPTPLRPRAGVGLPSGEVLLAAEGGPADREQGALLRFRDGKIEPAESLLGVTATVGYAGAALASDGKVWLMQGVLGDTLVGTVEEGFEPGPPARPIVGAMRLASSPPGEAPELFLHNVDLFRLGPNDVTWVPLGSIFPPGISPGDTGVAWIGPGEAMATSSVEGPVLHVRGDETIFEDPGQLGPKERYHAIGHNPEVGTLVSSDHAEGTLDRSRLFFRDLDGEWSELETPEITAEIRTIAPIDDGFLIGGFAGSFTQFYPDEGYCPVENARTGIIITGFVPTSEGYLAFGARESSELELATLKRLPGNRPPSRSSPSECSVEALRTTLSLGD